MTELPKNFRVTGVLITDGGRTILIAWKGERDGRTIGGVSNPQIINRPPEPPKSLGDINIGSIWD